VEVAPAEAVTDAPVPTEKEAVTSDAAKVPESAPDDLHSVVEQRNEEAEKIAVAPPQLASARIWPLFLGGVATSALGFGGALFLAKTYPQVIGIAVNPGVDQRLSDHDKRLTDLAGALAALPAPGNDPQTDNALEAAIADQKSANAKDVADLTKRLSGLETQLAALTARQDSLEASAPADGVASTAAINAATEAATSRANAAEEEAARAKAEAEAILKKSVQREALGELQSGFENGAALNGALSKLADTGISIPDDLASQAQGVPTLAALRRIFPAAARDALAASLAETAGGGVISRMTAFLRSQIGARSLTPRAGDDPDAVLSRAEAALGAGDLAVALSEIAALPDAGKARLAEWTGLAARRLAAGAAIASLAAEMGATQ
jgi:hypothetical protein